MGIVVVSKMPSNVVPYHPWHSLTLCEKMREDEIEQYLAFSDEPSYDPYKFDLWVRSQQGVQFTLLDKDKLPVICGGYSHVKHGVWRSWMMGTYEGWEKNYLSITRGTRWLLAALIDGGARRLETTVLSKRGMTVDWYTKSLGMVYEGTSRKYGAGGEDMDHFALVKEDIDGWIRR